MKANESQCVELKQRGAEHVRKLLSGKTQEEELAFWKKRTDKLRDDIQYNQGNKHDPHTTAL